MKSLLLEEANKFRIVKLPEPEISDDEVLVNIKAAAICGSDVHGYDGSSGRRKPPLILGHEASGMIAKKGAKVIDWNIGDRVTFDSTISCGHCSFCKIGKTNLCSNRILYGVSCDDYKLDGAMREYVSVPSKILYKIPSSVTFEQAAMIEPLSVAFHSVNITNIKLNDIVIVFGVGTIGMMIFKLLKVSNAGKIIVTDMDESKLQLARQAGADYCINATTDIVQKVKELTSGKGVDIAFEAVGIASTVKAAINCVKKGGIITLVGNVTPTIDIPLQSLVNKELSLNGSCASAGEYDRCIDMLANKKISVDDLISKVAPLEEGQLWFDRLHKGEKGLIKVVLKP
ncbi:MAG: galactitol-1-phosphate 5-dehydrogenase [Eubacteriales bacterium]|nr:galactitol-1-phosphate 5-dehydrogenase [Eubacteriales bacterium]